MFTKEEWKTYKNALGTWAVSTDNEPIAQVERHYNAQLIASAPDLYEALKLTRNNLQTLSDAALHYKKTFSANLKILNQALLKAEGK